MIFFLGASFVSSEGIELQVNYGTWSLSPFTTIVERESEHLIKREFHRLVEPIFPGYVTDIVLSDIDFASSGQYLALTLWYNFRNSRLALGVRGNYTDFSLPYDIYAKQSIRFLNFDLVSLETQGRGDINLTSITFSFLGRWKAFSSNRIGFYVYGGLLFFPYEGDLYLEQNSLLETPIGDITYEGSYDHTIKEVRKLDEDIPSMIFSPELGIQFQYRFLDELGLAVDASLSQGSFVSAGLFLSLF